MISTTISIEEQGRLAREASSILANSSGEQRNLSLIRIADAIHKRQDEIFAANVRDLAYMKEKESVGHLTERMTLSTERIANISATIRTVASLPDPVGEIIDDYTLPNGLHIQRIRVPLGVIGVIFESRPNVMTDISALCIKSGNACILRGGSDAFYTNSILADTIRAAMEGAGLTPDAVQFVRSTDRQTVSSMLTMDKFIDLLIPRGSSDLVHLVAENATMTAVTGGVGVCHTYVDTEANLDEALEIVFNAKVQRHTVCNALDTVLVHASVAKLFIPRLIQRFKAAGVELRLDDLSMEFAGEEKDSDFLTSAESSDFGREFLALIASVKVVSSLDEALRHIALYGSGHSEAIVTDDINAAERFLREVDSSVVFHNASTRFNDGGELGLGAEVAVSTDKIHARGPMGLREICSYKWIVRGGGHIRS